MRSLGACNAQVAKRIGKSREIVARWRDGDIAPSDENVAALCIALDCTEADLMAAEPPPITALTLVEWAHREGVKTSLARDLFALGILDGLFDTPFATMVPVSLRAPADSRSQVMLAKVRPAWVSTFHANFPNLLKAKNMMRQTMGASLGVCGSAVSHWEKRRNYPSQDRLPAIAEMLGVTVHELIGEQL